MNRKLLSALLIIAVSVVILLFNSADRMEINLVLGGDIEVLKSLALLIFMGLGVLVGILVK